MGQDRKLHTSVTNTANLADLHASDPNVIVPSLSDILDTVSVYHLDTITQGVAAFPLYNLKVKEIIEDPVSNVTLRGSLSNYELGYTKPSFSYDVGRYESQRGQLVSTYAIGYNDTTVLSSVLGYTDIGSPYQGALTYTEDAGGAISRLFYLYNDYALGHSELGTRLNNDGSSEAVPLKQRQLVNGQFPRLTVAPIRRLDTIGATQVSTIRTSNEVTYYGLPSVSKDANGNVSEAQYDYNGRLKTLWQPGDFPGDSLYTTTFVGTLEQGLSGWSEYTRTVDSCEYEPGSPLPMPHTTVRFSRLRAGGEPDDVSPCVGGVAKKKNDEVAVPIQYATWVRDKQWRAILNYVSYTNSPMETYTSLSSAELQLRLSALDGDCVHLIIEVCDSRDRNDVWLQKTFLLNCDGQYLRRRNNTSQTKDVGDNILSSETPADAQLVRMDVQSEIDRMRDEGFQIVISVATPLRSVEFVSLVGDYSPKLVLEGEFATTHPLADFTRKFDYLESQRQAMSHAKVEDSTQTISSSVGMGSLPEDNSRYITTKSEFGAGSRVLCSEVYHGEYTSPVQIDTTLFTQDGLGRTVSAKNLLHQMVFTEYNEVGQAEEVTNVDSTTVQSDFEISSDPASDWGITDQYFHGFGRKSIVVNEQGVKKHSYTDGLGRLRREVVDPDSLARTVKYEYDILGQLTEVVNPAGDTTKYTYDAFGQMKSKFQPDLGLISYAYDKTGKVRFVQNQQQADSSMLTYIEYDDLGRPLIVGEARIGGGHPVGGEGHGAKNGSGTISTSVAGRLTESIDASVLQNDGVFSSKVYWNATQYMTPVGFVPTLDTALQETNCLPDVSLSYFSEEYAPSGPYLRREVPSNTAPYVVASVDDFEHIAKYPEFVRSAVCYDTLPIRAGAIWGQLPRLEAWEALTPHGQFRNTKGRQVFVAYRDHGGQPFGYEAFSYDENGRIEARIKYTEYVGFEAQYYTYNSMHAVTTTRNVDRFRQHVTWYSYDIVGRLDSVWTKVGGNGSGHGGLASPSVPNILSRPGAPDMIYSYDDAGRVDSVNYPRIGFHSEYWYHERGWVDSMAVIQAGVMPVFTQALEFRNDGQIMSQRSQHLSQPVLTQDYAYDRTQQLIGWDNDLGGSVQSKSYAYDAVGNRLQTIESGITDIYSYGNTQHPNQLTQVANVSRVMSFLYDQNGSQTQKVTKPVAFPNDSIVESFSWSYASRLLNYSTSSFENSVETNEQWEYTYGPHGERQSKRRTGRSTGFQLETTHPWVYYGNTGAQQLSTWHGRQTLNDSCYLGQHVWMYPQEYIAYGAGSVHAIELTPSNNKRYKFTDHLGTTRLVVNDRNALVTQRDNKPFGGELFLFGVDTRKGFIDKETDSESGLGDFSARKYDNELGLFTRPDKFWERYPGTSPYVYGFNSPLSFRDPTGDTVEVGPENQGDSIIVHDLRQTFAEDLFYVDAQGCLRLTLLGVFRLSEARKALTRWLASPSQLLLLQIADLIDSRETTLVTYVKPGSNITNPETGKSIELLVGTNTAVQSYTENIDSRGGEITITLLDGNLVVGEGGYPPVQMLNQSKNWIFMSTNVLHYSSPLTFRFNNLIHAFGHVIFPSSFEQESVLGMDNAARLVSPSTQDTMRPLDPSHTNDYSDFINQLINRAANR